MSGHSRYAPSSAKANIACAGRLALIDSLPDIHKSVSGEAALLGTAAHALVERALETGKETVAFRDWLIEVTDDKTYIRKNNVRPIHNGRVFEVDSSLIDASDVCVSYVRDRCEELGVDDSTLQLETRTNPLPERDDTSGTADITIDSWPDVLEVVDYKNGYIVVEHTDNEQLLAYLLGKAIETDFAHKLYRVTVVQPNAGHEEGRVRAFECTKDDLLKFQKRYRKAIERCDAAAAHPAAPTSHQDVDSDWSAEFLKAGDHCFWCDAQAICPAKRALAQDQARMDFDDEPGDVPTLKSEEEVAKILKWAPYFDSLFRAADAFALRALENGYDVPGFKLVHGRSTRKWAALDEVEIVKAVKRGKFIKDTTKLFTKPKLISGPQAVALVDKRRRREFEELFLVKPAGSLTVAREDDPREGVLSGARNEFDAFDNEEES